MHQFYSIKNAVVFKCIFIVLILFSFKNLRSQDHTIDSLLEASQSELRSGELKKVLARQNIILKESQKKNYSKGIAMSYLLSGKCYQRLGDCGKALFFFNNALKEKHTQTDLSLKSEIITNIGNCYLQQSLYKDALEKYRLAIRVGETSEDINYIKAKNYDNIGEVHETLKTSKDSAYYYYSKAYYYFENDSKNKQIQRKKTTGATICTNLGKIWSTNNRIDSSKYYFNKAILYNNEAKDITLGAILEHEIGVLYYHSHDYKTAEYHLEKAKTIFEEKKDIYRLSEVYNLLSELNKILGNKKKHAEYRDSLLSIEKKINAVKNSARAATLDNVIKEKNEVFREKESRLYWIIATIVLITLLVIIFSVYFHKRKKNISVLRLKEERDIIQQKEMEATELKLKINESFDEVVQLAKDNSPEFFIRFQEVYPQVCSAILEINPRLISSELRFCALLFLNFSTKDIAEYTFTSPKTVQNRKNGIRKKLNIPSDTDLYIWFKNL
ncbi:LuxR C-terminal-related transcriptional regulator [Chryseobacterium shigense]|uniref:Tetratricopeptide (TPR) repeat protein/DNA-binding CsgD family transcriptional regulator n=1 Tax=Chryseobacterium shigense TaxID=297244 RepID=A0A841NLR1_9FLAO|nr:LuxR C-terminal-related transcriptional regulator [Chryseobacterium shigense]MBB6372169.1 tetratricopeptide (TPR) repeat protein/DNA-binding CsgD family transcriptional regulator [Chryseobacterium shigense]